MQLLGRGVHRLSGVQVHEVHAQGHEHARVTRVVMIQQLNHVDGPFQLGGRGAQGHVVVGFGQVRQSCPAQPGCCAHARPNGIRGVLLGQRQRRSQRRGLAGRPRQPVQAPLMRKLTQLRARLLSRQ